MYFSSCLLFCTGANSSDRRQRGRRNLYCYCQIHNIHKSLKEALGKTLVFCGSPDTLSSKFTKHHCDSISNLAHKMQEIFLPAAWLCRAIDLLLLTPSNGNKIKIFIYFFSFFPFMRKVEKGKKQWLASESTSDHAASEKDSMTAEITPSLYTVLTVSHVYFHTFRKCRPLQLTWILVMEEILFLEGQQHSLYCSQGSGT